MAFKSESGTKLDLNSAINSKPSAVTEQVFFLRSEFVSLEITNSFFFTSL